MDENEMTDCDYFREEDPWSKIERWYYQGDLIYWGTQFTFWLEDVPGALADFLNKLDTNEISTLSLSSCYSFMYDEEDNKLWGNFKHVKIVFENPQAVCEHLCELGYTIAVHPTDRSLDKPKQEPPLVRRHLLLVTTRALLSNPLNAAGLITLFTRELAARDLRLLSMYNLSLVAEHIRLAVAFKDAVGNYLSRSDLQAISESMENLFDPGLNPDFNFRNLIQIEIELGNPVAMSSVLDTLIGQDIFVEAIAVIGSGDKILVTFIPYSDKQTGVISHSQGAYERALDVLTNAGYPLREIPALFFNVAGGSRIASFIELLREKHIATILTVPSRGNTWNDIVTRYTVDLPDEAHTMFE